VTSVDRLNRSAHRSRPSAVCWECEEPSADLVEVSLPVPSISTKAVRLCMPCYTNCYLALVGSLSDLRETGTRSLSRS
jgi:hypothetical protein